jgi:hypothetical protein
MPLTLTPTEDDLATAVRALLVAILPAGTPVIQGQPNRVAEPGADNYVVFTPIAQQRLSTNVDEYLAGGATKRITMDNQAGFQLDIHGDQSSNMTNLINLLWRDDFSVVELAGSGVFPLYADEPHQAPFINAENQYENRWVMTVYMQANPVVIVPQDSADTLTIQLYEADQ